MHRNILLSVLLLTTGLYQTQSVLAQHSDNFIQHTIEWEIGETGRLQSTVIEVYVKERIVTLTGHVWLYEQKLISSQIAWMTLGVIKVNNEIRVVPKNPISDKSIKQAIREIVNADERFRISDLNISVNDGKVILVGSFLSLHDPPRLKCKIAQIEGVVDIRISAAFITY
ncbi:MAG: BON domain-containing protein [Candidatus Thiodiazotropha sp. (ex Monitilora ramsayi)]|nr:BON domain-containing protein [Candidatus Thiodiazotropha sp. (ex Monitilora ramsayi)]